MAGLVVPNAQLIGLDLLKKLRTLLLAHDLSFGLITPMPIGTKDWIGHRMIGRLNSQKDKLSFSLYWLGSPGSLTDFIIILNLSINLTLISNIWTPKKLKCYTQIFLKVIQRSQDSREASEWKDDCYISQREFFSFYIDENFF